MKYYYLGVDPAFRDNGFSVCLIEDGKAKFKMMKGGLLAFQDYVYDLPPNVIVCIENSWLQDVTFYTHKDKRSGALLTSTQARRNQYAVKLSPGEAAKASRSVGLNQATSQFAYEIAVRRWDESKVFQVSPREKGKKRTHQETMWIQKSEKHEFIGYRKSKQDDRDAYQLALIAIQKARQSWRKTPSTTRC